MHFAQFKPELTKKEKQATETMSHMMELLAAGCFLTVPFKLVCSHKGPKKNHDFLVCACKKNVAPQYINLKKFSKKLLFGATIMSTTFFFIVSLFGPCIPYSFFNALILLLITVHSNIGTKISL